MSKTSVVFISGLAAVVAKIQVAEKAKMHMAVNAARNEVLQTLTTASHRSTKTRFVPGTKQPYTPSLPGEPPAIASSRMFGSIRGRVESSLFGTEGQVGTPLDYPRILEKKMDRIWLALGMQRASAEIKRILRGRWF